MRSDQIETARRASGDFARFWQVFTYPGRATPEELLWAEDFFKSNNHNFRQLMELTTDPEQRAILELVYLGLFHLGYQLPVEFEYSNPRLN